METRTPLTEWEAKERAGLLALETEEWREKRLIAEDPNTTADVLEQFADAVWNALGRWEYGEYLGSDPHIAANTLLLTEAIVAHPNTPPRAFNLLLERIFHREVGERTLITKAVCRNPLLPFLILETPDFWLNLDDDVCKALLSEQALPPSAVRSLLRHDGCYMDRNDDGTETHRKDHSIAEAARLHTSQGPIPQTPLEGCKALTAFWKDYCIQQQRDPDYYFKSDYAKEWHAEMVEVGLAPAWMTTFYNNVPPVAPSVPAVVNIENRYAPHPEYAPLLHPDASPDDLLQIAQTLINRDYNDVQFLLLCHPHVTVDILRCIAEKEPDAEVRLHLAAHPLTPPDVLIQLVDVPLVPGRYDEWGDELARRRAQCGENALIRRLACRHSNAPPDLLEYSRHVFLKATEPPYPFMGLPLVDFVTALRGVHPVKLLTSRSEVTDWIYSLLAALYLPLTDTPLANDELGRSPLDLLHYLAHDGNRFVRWAAQTRLADPDFKFTWHDGD